MRIDAIEGAAPSERIAHSAGVAQSRNTRFSDVLGTAQENHSTHIVRRGDTLSEIVHRELQRVGLPASGRALYSAVRKVAQANDIANADFIVPGQQIELSSLGSGTPAAAIAAPRQVAQPASHAVFDRPARLSSNFGTRRDPIHGKTRHHNGVDLAAPTGTSIFPMWSGRVVFSGTHGGHGNTVIIRHANGTETLYAHASEMLVQKGQYVSTTTPIAEVGSTGRSTGPHLHMEMHRRGKVVNPLPYLQGSGSVQSI